MEVAPYGCSMRCDQRYTSHKLTQKVVESKAHKLFQDRLFGPHPKHPILGPPERVYVPHFLGNDAKKGPTSIFFWGGVLSEPIFGQGIRRSTFQ